jgi:hypothetical protein
MQWEFIVALVIAIPVILFPAAFVWYLNASGLYQVIRDTWQKRAHKSRAAQGRVAGTARALATVNKRVKTTVLALRKLAISLPRGAVLRVAAVLGVSAFLVWLIITGLGGNIMLLTLGLVIAILLASFLAALAWYMNVSGLYQVIRDTWQKRARERRLVQMLRQAMVQMLSETVVEEHPGEAGTLSREHAAK